MPTSSELKQRIEEAIPGADVDVQDLTGGGDHFHPAAQARLRRVRRGGRRPDPRAIHKDFDPGRGSVTNDEIRGFIDNAIQENEVMLFMKGTPNQPACGFSARTAGALNALGVQYAALDILPDTRIRQELSELSGWPTIPQLFVKGELVGGADIVMEMFENGELAGILGVEQAEDAAELAEPAPARHRIGLENRLD
jgi:monothiol glutaredoxin